MGCYLEDYLLTLCVGGILIWLRRSRLFMACGYLGPAYLVNSLVVLICVFVCWVCFGGLVGEGV